MINKTIFLKIGKMVLTSIFLLVFTYSLFVIISSLWIFRMFELTGLDFMFILRGRIYNPPENVVVIKIDEKSLKELGRFGEWPRSYYAEVIDYLSEGGAKIIGFHIAFLEESKIFPEGDRQLAEATRRAKNVYHSFFITGAEGIRLQLGKEKIVGSEISKFSWGKGYKMGFVQRMRGTPIFLIQPILKEAVGIGYTNVFYDGDGIVRKIQPLAEYKYEVYPCFALQIACGYLGIKKEKIKIIPKKSIILDKISIPLDSNNHMFINYRVSSFRHIPFSCVLKKEIPRWFFKDKIVLIGGTAQGLFDDTITPLNPIMPGIDVQANVIHNIINNDFITPLKDKRYIQYIQIGLGVIIGLILLYFSLLKGLILTSILILAYVVTSFILFNFKGIYIEIIIPTIVFIIIQIFFLATRAIVAERKKP